MKKILLFLSVLFAILFVNNAMAQNPTIDTVITTVPILCPGDEATVEVSSNSTITGAYTLSLFVQSGSPSGPPWNWVGNVSIPPSTFPISFGNGINLPAGGLYSGNYMAVLSDPLWSSTSGAFNFTDPLIVDTFAFTVFPAVPVIAISTLVDTNLCFGDCTASDSIHILGGQGPYTITLTQGSNPPGASVTLGSLVADTVYSNLCADSYVVDILDDNNCPTSINFTIDEPDLLVPGLTTADSITCFDADDGQMTVNPSGGTQPYTFEWYDANTGLPIVPAITVNPTGTVLPPGSYFAWITDANGCDTISDTVTFTQPDSLTVTGAITNPITCNGDCDGEITATIVDSGAGPPYTYILNTVPNSVGYPITQVGNPVFTGICAGDYVLTVTDANGCTSDAYILTINQPDPITFDIDTISYNGYGVSCNGVCDAQITIFNVNGGNLPPYGFSSSYLGGIIFDLDTIIASDTCTGTYTYIVTDSLGCSVSNSITINQPDPFSIVSTDLLTASGYGVSCPGVCDGTYDIQPFGGVLSIDYSIDNASFTSNIPGVTVQAINLCGKNTDGIDTIIAIDANGCIAMAIDSLTEPPLFNWDIGNSNENCALSNGSAWVYNVTGGSPGYIYAWTTSN